jgi:integrase
VLGRLQDFAEKRNKFHMSDLNVDLIEDFKTYGLTGKKTTQATLVAKLHCFFRDAYRRGWIKEPIVEKLKTVKAVYEEKQPYTDADIKIILDAAEKLNGGTSGFATNGKTFRLLLELMNETGLRVSDAVRYDPRKCQRGQFLWVYTFKPRKQKKNEKQKTADVFLTDRLKKAIDECKWFSPSLPFAYRPPAKADETDYLAQAVYERMQEIGKRCIDEEGKPQPIEDCRPHRLRHSFAVRCLVNDVGLEDVSKLLYHSSIAITEKYYAPWVPSRKLRLERLLFESIVEPAGR